jgi:hypothetical protein
MVGKNPAYPSASKSMKKVGELSRFARLWQAKLSQPAPTAASKAARQYLKSSQALRG